MIKTAVGVGEELEHSWGELGFTGPSVGRWQPGNRGPALLGDLPRYLGSLLNQPPAPVLQERLGNPIRRVVAFEAHVLDSLSMKHRPSAVQKQYLI